MQPLLYYSEVSAAPETHTWILQPLKPTSDYPAALDPASELMHSPFSHHQHRLPSHVICHSYHHTKAQNTTLPQHIPPDKENPYDAMKAASII
jgi:hypothetical protein